MKAAYRFNGFRLVPEDYRLEHKEQKVRLPPKAFRLLVALVEARGKLVSKEELIGQVWPELKYVEPAAFDQTLFTLRKHLEQYGQAEYVLTVPRQGYKWNVEVMEAAADRPKHLFNRQKLVGRVAALITVAGAGWLAASAWYRGRVPAEAAQALEDGRKLWRLRERGADAHFRRAINLAPNYAPAYAALGAAYAFYEPPAPEAFQAVEKALALDPNLGEAYATLGFLQMVHRWNWSSAKESFERALRLAPKYPTAHHWYGIYLRAVGRNSEARRHLEEAARLDPESPAIQDDLGQQALVEGRLLEAISKFDEIGRRDPDAAFWKGNRVRALVLLKGVEGSAFEIFNGANPEHQAILRNVRARGVAAIAEAMAEIHLERRWPYAAAESWMMAGRRERALDALEAAVKAHTFGLFEVKANPFFAPLHGEPRFHAVLKAIGLPPN